MKTRSFIRSIAAVALMLNLHGCANFNNPQGSDLFFVGATNSPRITGYWLSANRNSFETLFTSDPSFSVSYIAAGGGVVVYSSTTKVGSAKISRSGFSTKTDRTINNVGVAVAPTGTSAYYIASDAFTVGHLAVSDATLASTATTKSVGGVSSILYRLEVSSDSSKIYASPADGGFGSAFYGNINTNGTLGALIDTGVTVPGELCIAGFWKGAGTNVGFMAEPLTSYRGALGTSSASYTGIGHAFTSIQALVTHPSKPWAYLGFSTGIRQYTASSTTVSITSTTATAGTTLGLAITDAGDRLIRLTSSQLSLYSISDTGVLTLITTVALSNTATSLASMSNS